ncbi:DNA primase, partial [Shigella sonnei]|nr:DNA primase [Shigella sonnei]
VTNGDVIIPAFTEAEKAQGLTDFNDLDASRGRDNFQNAMNAQLKHIGILTPNSDTADHREAVVIGNLIFTPVKNEKPQMSPENRQSTAPETELATQDTPYDTHSDDTENQAYEDDYAAYASLQSVTAETLSPDKPLENIASAADTGTENTSVATAGDQEDLNTDATGTDTAHNSDTAETGTLPEPAGMQSVQQATTEPTAEDKPHENVVSAADTREENASVATADTGEENASATTADNQSTQAEEHPRSEDTPETSLSDAAGTQHTTTTQSEEQVQVSMASADDWSAFAEDLNADTPGAPTVHNTDNAETNTVSEPAGMRPVQQVTTELTAEDKAQEKSVASAAETGAEHSSDITDDNRNAPAEELNADATVAVHNTGTAETASPSEPAETQPVRQATAE